MNPSLASPALVFEFPDCSGQPRCLAFTDPERVVVAHCVEDVRPAVRAAQAAAAAGRFVAGYLAYEAAPAFDPALVVRPGPANAAGAALPLVWFGIFRSPSPVAASGDGGAFHLSRWRPAITEADYRQGVTAIREAIAAGETYQVNHTLRLRAQFEGDDFTFYRRLRAAQSSRYCAYLNLGRYRILSASPELFFHRSGDRIVTRPMKGTRPRGRWPEEDLAQAAALAASEKERAENVMIVDLLRSDLGRVAARGTVRVPHLWQVERYPTLFQMTSTIVAQVPAPVSLEDVLAALFPCGSVTGAPKVRSMQFIAALEESARRIYCGAIGLLTPATPHAPAGESHFSVAIRTVLLDTQTGQAEYGVGGAITWDSTPAEEYAEAMTKAAVLTEEPPRFELLETLRLEAGHYALLERHLERLADSARYFEFPLTPGTARDALAAQARAEPTGDWRVRLLVSQDGRARTESVPLAPLPGSPRPVALAAAPVSRQDRFLCHKTTRRGVYEAHRRARPDGFDVLLWNEQGELTEFTTGNLVVEQDGRRWTPPRDCGLLAGTFRAELLAQGRVRERVLREDDLRAATGLWLINSVRGWVPVTLTHPVERRTLPRCCRSAARS